MSASMPWVKLYTEMLDDPKIGRLKDDLKWRFVQLVLYAGEQDQEGYLPANLEDVAWRLRLEVHQVQDDLAVLEANKLVHWDDMAGRWIVTAFARRQGRSQEEKREQWREAQKRRRGVDWDDPAEDDTEEKPDEVHTSVINDTSMSHTPREDKSREEKKREEVGAKAPPRRSRSDPRSKHPAILLAHGIGGKYPPKELYDEIIQVVGEHPDGEKAASCRKEWVRRGYNGNAWTWLTEWYVSGIPSKGGGGNNGSKPKVYNEGGGQVYQG